MGSRPSPNSRVAPSYSPACDSSTIGSTGLNGSVRNGIKVSTRLPSTNPLTPRQRLPFSSPRYIFVALSVAHRKKRPNNALPTTRLPPTTTHHGAAYAYGAISTAQLNASPRLHLPPIHVVVSHTPFTRKTHLEASFALRCLQRLSVPHVATRPCLRPDNRSASGESIPVLSY